MILISQPLQTGLRGEFSPPGDKSMSHRALIFSSLAEGQSELSGLLESEDTLATLKACEQLGAKIERRDGKIYVSGTAGDLQLAGGTELDMGNSGTAMRLLAGVLSGQPFASRLSGDASLNSRPMRRIVDPLRLMGANIQPTQAGTAPLEIAASVGLTGIDYASPVASAQIKSCVLLAGLYASGNTSVLEPRLSRDHTERMLPCFGVVLPAPCTVTGGSRLKAAQFAVPADISSAVFSLAAAALVEDSDITLTQVGLNPTRDGFLHCLREMGAAVTILNQSEDAAEPVGDIHIRFNGVLTGIDLPVERVPDMIDELPLLMALAATARGVTRIRGAAELRVKESDRIAVMAAGLKALGVALTEYPDGIEITGCAEQGGKVNGGVVESACDHRCAMSFAVLGLAASGPVRIKNAEYIATSYPVFLDDMNHLGARLETAAQL